MGKYRQDVARLRHLTWHLVFMACISTPALSALNDPIDNAAQEQLRQLERERLLRGQQEIRSDERKSEY